MTENNQRSSAIKSAGLLGLLSLMLYCLTAYGGIRTPDGEIVFRVGHSLAERGSFALENDLQGWEGFATARGSDDNLYASFAPAQSVLLAPVIKAALIINQTRWYEGSRFKIPISFCADAASLKNYVLNQPPTDIKEHALRFLVSFFTPLVASLLVAAFFLLMRRITASLTAAFITGALLAFATPLWSYSGTMFKEPLTMLWIILSLLLLAGDDPIFTGNKKRLRPLFFAGLLLGLAFTSHITAILFAPFFIVYAGWPIDIDKTKHFRKTIFFFARYAGTFTAGFLIPTAAYAVYNEARFDNLLEVGRATSSVTYGALTLPWEGLTGLSVSPGKGLLWFCPLAAVGACFWPRLHKKHRVLSFTLLSAIAFRLVFLSCRTDWHGGFCLGPRHLLPVIPLLLIPLGLYFKDLLNRHPSVTAKKGIIWAGLFLSAAAQQIYFCLGEPISFYYLIRNYFFAKGVSVLAGNDLYFQWSASPLLHLLKCRRGPFLLQGIPATNYQLLAALICGFALLTGLAILYWLRMHKKP